MRENLQDENTDTIYSSDLAMNGTVQFTEFNDIKLGFSISQLYNLLFEDLLKQNSTP